MFGNKYKLREDFFPNWLTLSFYFRTISIILIKNDITRTSCTPMPVVYSLKSKLYAYASIIFDHLSYELILLNNVSHKLKMSVIYIKKFRLHDFHILSFNIQTGLSKDRCIYLSLN